MRTFRRVLSVYFMALAVLCAAAVLAEIRNLLQQQTSGSYLVMLASLVAGALLGTAGWVLWRQDASKKRWVTAASLLSLAVSIGPIALDLGLRAGGIRLQPGAFLHAGLFALVPMAFGIAGLFAFPRERPAGKRAR